jgi:mycothiol synthase
VHHHPGPRPLAPGLRLRRATRQDMAPITVLLDHCRRQWTGQPHSQEETAARFAEPGADLLLVTRDHDLLGFGQVWPASNQEIRLFARTRPDALGLGIGTTLLTALTARAHTHLRSGRPTGPATLTTTSWAGDPAAASLLHTLGFAETRYFLHMHADLAQPRTAGRWPAGVTARTFDSGRDDAALFAAFTDAFAEHWGQQNPDPASWWYDHRDSPAANFDPSLWTLAIHAEQIVGFALCAVDDTDPATGQLMQLGVRASWRHRGLGHALLTASLRQLADRGLRHATLTVDTANPTSALRLYC